MLSSAGSGVSRDALIDPIEGIILGVDNGK